MNEHDYRKWPSWRRVLPSGRQKSATELVKYFFRLAYSARWRAQLLNKISDSHALRGLYARRPQLLHVPLSSFVDRRRHVASRFSNVARDLDVALALFGETRIIHWSEGGSDLLSEPRSGLRISLSMNEVNPQEGLWAVNLRDERDDVIYNASFAFLDRETLLVGSIQGPSGEKNKELVRDLTKLAHGLRPPYLLVEVLRYACECWGLRRLFAIDPLHHVKGRWNQRRKRLKFNYRELWEDVGGTKGERGYWELPISPERRGLDTVPSRKRSAYRQRFELLDEIHRDVTHNAR